jgi:hypothetical protein
MHMGRVSAKFLRNDDAVRGKYSSSNNLYITPKQSLLFQCDRRLVEQISINAIVDVM